MMSVSCAMGVETLRVRRAASVPSLDRDHTLRDGSNERPHTGSVRPRVSKSTKRARSAAPSGTSASQHMTRMSAPLEPPAAAVDRKSTRLNSSHLVISYAVFCLKKKNDDRDHVDAHQHIDFLRHS